MIVTSSDRHVLFGDTWCNNNNSDIFHFSITYRYVPIRYRVHHKDTVLYVRQHIEATRISSLFFVLTHDNNSSHLMGFHLSHPPTPRYFRAKMILTRRAPHVAHNPYPSVNYAFVEPTCQFASVSFPNNQRKCTLSIR